MLTAVLDGTSYRVCLEMEAIDDATESCRKVEGRLELASFGTLEEARDFCVELCRHHAAQAAGEGQLQEDLECAELYSAGD